MKSSLNRINGQYQGQSKLYENDGLLTVNKDYNRLIGASWVRPNEWLQMPSLDGITQAIVGLLAVIPGFDSGHTGITSNSNFISFQVQGAYSVDWGDGRSNTYASGAVASQQYNYYSLPNANYTQQNYKQMFITITPQAGNNLTGFFLNQKPVISGVTIGVNAANILHWLIKTPFLNNSASLSTSNSNYPLLKIVEWIGPTSLTTTNLTQGMNILECIGGDRWTENMTTAFGSLFVSCESLGTIPLLDSRKATNFNQLFNGAARLSIVPPLDSNNVTNFTNSFNSCYKLETIPFLNTSKVTLFDSTFNTNTSLQKIPDLNFSAATSTTSTFNTCRSLQSLPTVMDISNTTNATSMFSECNSLKRVPKILDVSKATTLSSMFSQCNVLEVVPDLNVISGRGNALANIFQGNGAMWKTGLITLGTGATGNHSNAFNGARTLITGISWAGGTLQGISFANLSTTVGFFPQSMRVAPAYNVGSSISYRDTHLSPTAVNEVFTSLASLPSGATATINITNVWGSSGCDRTIATSKNWTVIG